MSDNSLHRQLLAERVQLQRKAAAKAPTTRMVKGAPLQPSTAHQAGGASPAPTTPSTTATSTSSAAPKPKPKAKIAPRAKGSDPRDEQLAMVPCRYFVYNGHCPQGSRCKFSHHPSLIGMSALLDPEDRTVAERDFGAAPYPPPAATAAVDGLPTQDGQPNVDAMSYDQLTTLCDRMGKVKVGVPKTLLSRFPTITVVTETDQKCSICLDGFATGQVMRILPCDHAFHKECIDGWLDASKKCPNCNVDVTESAPAGPSTVEDVMSSLQNLDIDDETDESQPTRPTTSAASPSPKRSPPKKSTQRIWRF